MESLLMEMKDRNNILAVPYHPEIFQHSKFHCCSGFVALVRLNFGICLRVTKSDININLGLSTQ